MKYESNIQKVVLQFENKLNNIQVSKLQREIATYLKASNLARVNEGKALDGTLIGSYNSTNELYVNPAKSPKVFPPRGKNGELKFKNGKPHKTGYFPSYRDFRKTIGRKTGIVNLQLSGKMFEDWIMMQEGKDWVIGFASEYGANVSHGNEKHFAKKIWGVSREDLKMIDKIIKEFIKKIHA